MSSIRSRAPVASSPTVRRAMKAVPSGDTRPEIRLRSTLFRLGMRFRKNNRPESDLRVSADIVFPKERVCVFIDGCYWHGCPDHFKPPKTNRDWWIEKIQDNHERDLRQTAQLRKRGWSVIRLWEHQVAGSFVDRYARQVERRIERRRRLTSACS